MLLNASVNFMGAVVNMSGLIIPKSGEKYPPLDKPKVLMGIFVEA